MSLNQGLLDNSFDELGISHSFQDDNDRYFYEVIGFIEDIILHDNFLKLNTNFMEKYWRHFEDSDENKFIYTDIFHEYCAVVEKYIEIELAKSIPNFNMNKFENELRKRQTEMDGEVFDILSTFSDFVSFKNQFLDYRAMKEGRIVDLSKELSVVKLSHDL